MENEIEIQLKAGTVKLKKPKAGVRNTAMQKAETEEGKIKQSVFMVAILPLCISEHPWGTTPLSEALENLDIDEYDALVEGLNKFSLTEADTKKSEQ